MNAPITNVNVIDKVVKALSASPARLLADDKDTEQIRQAMRLFMEKADARQAELISQEIVGQMEINMVESRSGKFFHSGWRPIVGWVSVAVLAYFFILRDVIKIIAFLCFRGDIMSKFPEYDVGIGAIIALLTGMLGIGGMRSFDKNSRVKKGGTGA